MAHMDNRSRILDCAQQLFAARGYDAVGVQEIVEAAGVTKPSLYHYFNHKRGLLDALLEERFSGFLAQLQQASAYDGDVTMSLRRVAQAYFAFARQQPEFYRMQLSMHFSSPNSESNQAVARFSLQQYHLIEAMFAAAAQSHGNMHGRQQAYAATWIGMLNNYIGLYLNSHIHLDDLLVYQTTQQFMYGIFS
jgi:AcrR family transcriptional regulator